MFDLSGVVLGLASGTYTVTRHVPAGFDSNTGKTLPGSTTQFSFTGSVQPLTGRELARLQELEDVRGAVRIFSPTEMQIADQSTLQKADTLVYQGQTYEVDLVYDWNEHGNYREYRATYK